MVCLLWSKAGVAVSLAGDVNGDGLSDVLIGARYGNSNAGQSYVVFGKTSGTAVQLSTVLGGTGGFVINGRSSGDAASSVRNAGDVNGDGISDLIVGAFNADVNGNSAAGQAYVVFGKTSGTTLQLSAVEAGTGGFVINGQCASDKAGFAVSSAGDINGDGLSDLLVGAFLADPRGGKSGQSYVIFGKTSGTAVQLSTVVSGSGGFAINGANADDYSAHDVMSAGDVNGDGLADLIVGAYYADPNGLSSGQSYVIFGSSNFVTSSVSLGTTGADTMTGTISADYIISGDGADTVDGNGGADVLYTGNGNDLIKIDNNSFTRIDGGAGTDTLRFDAAISLDLTSKANDKLVGINAIDMSADGGNSTLTLNIFDLYDMTDEVEGLHHDLTITASSGDTIALATATTEPSGGLWVKNGSDYEYRLSDNTVTAEIHLSGAATVTGVDSRSVTSIELSTIIASSGAFAINGLCAGDQAGIVVSNAGDVNGDGLGDFLVGAWKSEPHGSDTSAGQTYVVFGTTSAATVQASALLAGTGGFVINGNLAFDYAGRSMSAGDVNGDGLADILATGRLSDVHGNHSGQAYVIFGKTSGSTVELSAIMNGTGGFGMNGESAEDYAGFSMGAGDVNGDGLNDIILSAHQPNAGAVSSNRTGKAYVIFGKTTGTVVELSTVASGTGGYVINGNCALDHFGRSAAQAGDVNGDGLMDVIIGAMNADPNSLSEAGQCYVVFGKTSGTAIQASSVVAGTGGFAINGISASETIGRSVAGIGDVNGDGLADVVIGSRYGDHNGITNAGQTFVVFGKTSGTAIQLSDVLAGTGGFVIDGGLSSDNMGSSVNSAGDFNGDGLNDILIGAHLADPNGASSGQAYVVYGKTSGSAVMVSDLTASGGSGLGFAINGMCASDRMGLSVSTAGDVNGDGISDLIVGSYTADPNGADSGQAYVIYGSSDLISPTVTLGTTGADTMTGTSSADYIISGAGNDTIDGGGGADVLSGGGGNDLIKIDNNSFTRIDGGFGTDTLRFDAAISLNLTSLSNDKLVGINAIDMSNDGGNSTLTLNLFDLFDMTDEASGLHHDLAVTGAAGDTLTVSTASNQPATGTWVHNGSDYDFTVGSEVLAQIHVTGAMTVNV